MLSHNTIICRSAVFLTVLGLLMTGCAEPDGAVGSSVGVDLGGRFAWDSFHADADTSYAAPQSGTGGSPHLYVGRAFGITAEPLLRFNKPPEPWPIDWWVDSARIDVHYQGGISDDDFPPLEGFVIDLAWREAEPPEWGSLPGGAPVEVRIDYAQPDSGSAAFILPPEMVANWLSWVDSSLIDTSWHDTTRADSGLTLCIYPTPVGCPTRLARLRSRSALEDSLRPRLSVFITARDSAGGELHPDTLQATPSDDLFLIQNDETDTGDRLVIGSGAVFRSLLRFDVSRMWTLTDSLHIVVNRAIMTLHRDRSPYPWASVTRSVFPFKLTDDRWLTEPDSAQIAGFVITPTVVDTSADSLQIVVTGPVAGWIADPECNHGLALYSGSEGLDIDRIAFYSMRAPEPLRPRLTIYWTEFPK